MVISIWRRSKYMMGQKPEKVKGKAAKNGRTDKIVTIHIVQQTDRFYFDNVNLLENITEKVTKGRFSHTRPYFTEVRSFPSIFCFRQ